VWCSSRHTRSEEDCGDFTARPGHGEKRSTAGHGPSSRLESREEQLLRSKSSRYDAAKGPLPATPCTGEVE
jgi:hypothetical protein